MWYLYYIFLVQMRALHSPAQPVALAREATVRAARQSSPTTARPRRWTELSAKLLLVPPRELYAGLARCSSCPRGQEELSAVLLPALIDGPHPRPLARAAPSRAAERSLPTNATPAAPACTARRSSATIAARGSCPCCRLELARSTLLSLKAEPWQNSKTVTPPLCSTGSLYPS